MDAASRLGSDLSADKAPGVQGFAGCRAGCSGTQIFRCYVLNFEQRPSQGPPRILAILQRYVG